MKSQEYPVGHPEVLTREILEVDTPFPWTRDTQNKYKGITKAASPLI